MSDNRKNAFIVFGTLLIQVMTLVMNNIDAIAGITL